MYRPASTPNERAATVMAVVLVHMALAYALLNLAGGAHPPESATLTQLIAISRDPPPMVIVDPPSLKLQKKDAAASAKNIESKATELFAPKPAIPLPSTNPMIATETPRLGTQATQGASDVVGPGTGAGGTGNGDGSGGAGNGNGGGGDGLAVVRTRLATRPLSGRDFPDYLLDSWPSGAWIRMRFRVDANGFILQCLVDEGTGRPEIDRQICAIARQRLHYQPGLDRSGQRVADWAGYGQEPPR